MPTRFLEDRAQILIALLAERGLTMSTDACKILISTRITSLSQQLGMSEASARKYFSDEALSQMADSLADEIADECPGTELHTLPRTASLPFAVAGRTVSAMSEALLLFETHGGIDEFAEPPTRELIYLLSILGSFISENSKTAAAVRVPPAFLYRAARNIDNAAAHPDAIDDLRAAFHRDAIRLRAAAS